MNGEVKNLLQNRLWQSRRLLSLSLFFGLSWGLSGFSFSNPNLLTGGSLWLKRPQMGLSDPLHLMGDSLLRDLPLANGDVPLVIKQSVSAFSPSTSLISSPIEAFTIAQSPVVTASQGEKVVINGKTYRAAWSQWQEGNRFKIGLSDTAAMQLLGMELLSTNNPNLQPVGWFSASPMTLKTRFTRPYRYLDITDLAQEAGMSLEVVGDSLKINAPLSQLVQIRQGRQDFGDRIVLDLDRPAFWQISQVKNEAVITLEGKVTPELLEQFTPKTPVEAVATGEQENDEDILETPVTPPLVSILDSSETQTKLRINIPNGSELRVWTLPKRLVIDMGVQRSPAKDILWQPGLRWRQQMVELESDGEEKPGKAFPMVWLEVNPRTSDFALKPIVTNPTQLEGTAPLVTTARLWQASAAINGGFFNRNNQLPLGAIRRDGLWLSSPILDRGAIAWNDLGQIKIGRLSLEETLITSTGVSLPVLFQNSGYVKKGIARYTPEWGANYKPLTDNEIVVFVENNQVVSQLPGGKANQNAFPIPKNGYLLTLRSEATLASYLTIGTQLSLSNRTTPEDFSIYPHILGAGPLLLNEGKIVLDGTGEQFSEAFNNQAASRSAIATTKDGKIILAAIHNLPGERGATLKETAQLMQKIGAENALNLDGGSSTSLSLGGQLLDRSPVTAARVHNGLGLFPKSVLSNPN